MVNIKNISTSTDGNVKRIAYVYDVLDDKGTALKSNVRGNKAIFEESILKNIEEIENYINNLISEE